MTPFELSSIVTCVVTGLYAGSMLTEAGVLVPYWRKMPPEEFLRLHHTLAPTLFRFFAPLTVLGTLLPALNVVFGSFALQSVSTYSWIAAVISLGVLSIYFGYFKPANQSFAEGSDGEEAANTLRAWTVWHYVRTLATMIVFSACVLAL